MSTGGKVLVVLISLLTVTWVVLMSLVARHNSNHGDLVKKGEVALASLEQQIAEATKKLRDLENEVEANHFVNDRDRTKDRLVYSDQNRALSEMKENLERISGLLDNLDKANEKTELNVAERKKEIAETERLIVETTASVNESMNLNTSLRMTLADLRDRFMRISEENRTIGQRLRGTSFEDVSPGARPLISGR